MYDIELTNLSNGKLVESSWAGICSFHSTRVIFYQPYYSVGKQRDWNTIYPVVIIITVSFLFLFFSFNPSFPHLCYGIEEGGVRGVSSIWWLDGWSIIKYRVDWDFGCWNASQARSILEWRDGDGCFCVAWLHSQDDTFTGCWTELALPCSLSLAP